MKLLSLDRAKCSSCGACQAVCSIAKKGELRPSESRIKVRRAGGPETQYASVCQHCTEPVCVTACMRGIIDKDPQTGIVSRNYEDCFTCAACAVMCPMGAVVYDSELDAFMTCDMCGGDPVCVRVCPTGALKYEEPADVSARFRSEYAESMFFKGREEE